MSRLGVVLSCEHGGNEVPADYRGLFRASAQTLASHRGWDPGARHLAERYADRLGVPLEVATVTRLLVDCNRSEDSPSLFSPFVRRLSARDREQVLALHYRPYRARVRRAVLAALERHERVVHLSVHSFTPALRGVRRATDIGLLFDPKSALEAEVCARWRAALVARDAGFTVHDNQPYRGDADGLTTTLRRELGGARYAGLELEVNQKYPRRYPKRWEALQAVVVDTFAQLVAR